MPKMVSILGRKPGRETAYSVVFNSAPTTRVLRNEVKTCEPRSLVKLGSLSKKPRTLPSAPDALQSRKYQKGTVHIRPSFSCCCRGPRPSTCKHKLWWDLSLKWVAQSQSRFWWTHQQIWDDSVPDCSPWNSQRPQIFNNRVFCLGGNADEWKMFFFATPFFHAIQTHSQFFPAVALTFSFFFETQNG